MITKKEIYNRAYKELEVRRINSQSQQKNCLKIAIAKCPEIEQLNKELKKTSLKLIKLIFEKKNHKENISTIISKIQSRNIKTKDKIKDLLKNNKFPDNYLKLKPYCKNCNDYGKINNKHCNCLKTIIKKIMISEFQKSFHVKLTNFESFNLNLYSKEKSSSNNGISDYDNMSVIFKICKNFAKNFPKVSYGLIMHGLTGLGKTHLSMAIASEIISKNFTVIYATAPELTRKILEFHFNKNQNNEINILDLAFKSDLLIIDDFGTEFESKINQTSIFEILNKRMTFQKPIILNTNLNFSDIAKQYDTRIFSRISANLLKLNFVGTDIRQKLNPIKTHY